MAYKLAIKDNYYFHESLQHESVSTALADQLPVTVFSQSNTILLKLKF